MIKDGKSGATTQTGLTFENKVDLLTLLTKIQGYTVQKSSKQAGSEVHFNGELVARAFKKHDFYRFLAENDVDWAKILSKRLLPDDALLVIVRETLFIIEVKYQQTAGSVDEKLQTCDFKRKQYVKLVQPLGLKVEYVYVLNDWFKKSEYRDVLDYINSVCCHYKFNELPLAWLGLPI
ncbi:MAG: hypothetical protein FWG68_00520 [Defluviitaleaceae bacterium]|nr:hypothetical protein [Defluviitaleaceae bacterium]